MTTEEKASEAYRLATQVVEQVSGKGTAATIELTSTLLGQNVLREEIGYFGDWEGANYNLTEAEKNRLLAHARQDIASTHSLSTAAMRAALEAQKSAKKIGKRLNIALILQAIIIFMLLIILVK